MKEDYLIEVGRRIKLVRKALNVRQKDFAEAIELSFSYLSEIEAGTKPKPSINAFYRISSIFNVSLDYLFHGKEPMFFAVPPGSEGEFPSGIGNLEDLLWLMDRSLMFKDTVMGFCSKYFYENEDIIKKSIRPPVESSPSKAGG